MFGLMRFHNCASYKNEREAYQQHYCGVCKTLGTYYSQKIRFLLNQDFVFLGEILTDMSGTKISKNFSDRCFSNSRDPNLIPLPLQIAAAVNVLYSECKINDNISDAQFVKRQWWKFIRLLFSKEFKKVSRILKQWQFPMEDIRYWINEQKRRESNGNLYENAEETILYYSEPTAEITGLAFRQAAIVIGKEQEADNMYHLGYTFGRLLYLLDALDDFDDDTKKQAFNTIRAAYHIHEEQLSPQDRNASVAIVSNLEKEMQQTFLKLNISENKALYFQKRLAGNVKRKVSMDGCLSRAKCNVEKIKQKMRLREKWNYAIELSKTFINASKEQSVISKCQTYILSPVLTILIFLTPQALFGQIESHLSASTTKVAGDSGFWAPVLLFLFVLGLATNDDDEDDSSSWCYEHCCCFRWLVDKCCKPVIEKCVEAICGSICKQCQDRCNQACDDCCKKCCSDCCKNCCSDCCKNCCESCKCCRKDEENGDDDEVESAANTESEADDANVS